MRDPLETLFLVALGAWGAWLVLRQNQPAETVYYTYPALDWPAASGYPFFSPRSWSGGHHQGHTWH